MKIRTLASFFILVLAVLIVVGSCATTPPLQREGILQREDMVKRFSVSLEELYEASKEACRDLGAKIVTSEIDEDGGKLEAHRSVSGSKIKSYLILFSKKDDSVEMMVFIGYGSQGITMVTDQNKPDFDKFWATLDTHL